MPRNGKEEPVLGLWKAPAGHRDLGALDQECFTLWAEEHLWCLLNTASGIVNHTKDFKVFRFQARQLLRANSETPLI